jgi:hypothetical protein
MTGVQSNEFLLKGINRHLPSATLCLYPRCASPRTPCMHEEDDIVRKKQPIPSH